MNIEIKGAYKEGLVSVIVPCYNREKIITETLESIKNQTYRPIELVIIDDGSLDDSVRVIERWLESKLNQDDDNFTIHTIYQQNRGVSSARNAGLVASKGEYINFVDSDDLLHPDKLLEQVSAIKRSEKDFCVCNYQRFKETIDDTSEAIDFFSRSHNIDDFPLAYPMNTPAPLYKKKAVKNTGYWNEAISAGEDFEYNFRLICRGAKGVWIDRVLLYVRVHDSVERIQSTPLRTRYRDMYHGLAEMEMEALEQNHYTNKLRISLGVRALNYAEHMKAEDDAYLAQIFRRYAYCRVPLWRIALFYFNVKLWKPVWKSAYPAGPRVLLKKLVR